MSVVILDSHRMVGQAIAGMISQLAGETVNGVCTSVAEACVCICHSPPRLLVLDVEFADESYRDAADLIQRLRPDARLLFLTAQTKQFTPPNDLAPITIGVVDKAQTWKHVLAVLQPFLLRSERNLKTGLPRCVEQLEAIKRLNPREQRLLRELGYGLLNKEIAARLKLTLTTVETYRKQVAAKLGASGPELLRLAILYRTLSWDLGSPATASISASGGQPKPL